MFEMKVDVWEVMLDTEDENIEDEPVPFTEVELDNFEVLFPILVVFANQDEVKVGPVGSAVLVEMFKMEEVELLDVIVLIRLVVVEFAFKDTVETELAEVRVEEVLLAFATRYWYSVRPFGPPQIKPGLPAQGILHRPSVTGAGPETRVFPQ